MAPPVTHDTTGPVTSPAATASQTGATRSSRSVGTRGNLGAGLVEVPPVPPRDPASVVLSDPQVPEHKRFCGACNGPVGRSRGDRPPRSDGYCPQCGHAFSFSAKLAAGETVGGQYEVVGPIAHGGLGWVYLARDHNVSDRWVVLKGLLDSGDPGAMAAAIAERQFLARVEHPNIVRIYNFVTHQGAGYIVMEYVGGASLKDLRQAGPFDVARAIAYALEILPALGYLHARGLLYCDFKPDNVIQDEEQLKLIDLGGVRGVDDDQSDLYGTVGYQAPEVPRSGASVSSDLYTVGRTLAVLTFDFRGFQDPARFATGLPAAEDVAVLARYPAFDAFLRRATHTVPSMRFATAAEMAEQLTGVLRQVVAADGGRPPAAPSRLFTAELLSETGRPEWRDLPAPVVDPNDDAAGLLAGLAAAPPEQLLAALSGVVPTAETRFALCRAHLEVGDSDAAGRELEAPEVDAGDWRVAWWRGVGALASDRAGLARQDLETVAAALPGELAPLLALAFVAESEGPRPEALDRAAALYQRVLATGPQFVGAAFGLARVRLALGDRGGAADALSLVPASSAFRRAAQEERCRVLVGAPDAAPGDLAAAARSIEALDTDPATRLALTRLHLSRVLDGGCGISPQVVPSGITPTETGVRSALERTCRSLARLAGTRSERIALVDEANARRARTLL